MKFFMRLGPFHPTSLLRILPAAFVGLLPFNILDGALLRVQYSIRGERIPGQRLTVIQASESDNPSALIEGAKIVNPKQCISFIPDLNFRRLGCQVFDLTQKFSLDSYESLYPFIHTAIYGVEHPIPDPYSISFYGKLPVFNPLRASLYSYKVHEVIRGKIESENDSPILVVIPENFNNKFRLETPAGFMTSIDVGLNVVGNAVDKISLKIFSRYTQFLVSLASATIVAWVLYTYPIFLTLLFTLIFAGFLFVVAMISFDKAGYQLPLAAPWISIVSVYLLGLSDRLDKRERKDWALDQKAQNLVQLDEMRNNFLSLVSHDLKTPIARMQSVLERLSRGEFGSITQAQSESISKILSASGDLQRTISTLLILSRIESRDLRIKREPTDLNEILQTCVEQHQQAVKDRGIRIVTDFEPLFLLDLDKGLIAEVASNILDNAARYSPDGSTIRLKSGELSVCPELSPPQEGIWFEIQDEGPGIPAEERDRVFQKFVRGVQESTPSQLSIKGTGLGLYLSKFFVEKHGGVVSLYSKTPGEIPPPGSPQEQYFGDFSIPRTGTVFRVTLPIEAPVETP